MNDVKWFSAKLRFAILVESHGGDTLNDCLFVFKAKDFSSAFERTIAIGEAQQVEYHNSDDKRVIWKFMEVISLDIINAEELDGAEIYSEPIHLDEQSVIPFDQVFAPEASKPIQTI